MHRGMRVINLIVVHCSATKADRDFTEQDLEVCHRRRGMNGPGYHFYIRKNGDIKTTRPIEKIVLQTDLPFILQFFFKIKHLSAIYLSRLLLFLRFHRQFIHLRIFQCCQNTA